MSRNSPLDDAAIEAFFTGQPAGEALDSLAGFVADLRSVEAGPAPVPSTQLAAMLAEGFSPHRDELLVTPAGVPEPAPQVAGSSWTRKKKMLIAEFLTGLGVASKAVFGISMAAASVTAGGAAGVLPGPAQGAVATAVEAATPFSMPEGAADKAKDAKDKAAKEAKDNFGTTVSADARDGGVDGQVISDAAKQNGNRPDDAGPPADAGRPDDAGRPAAPGQQGLDRANTTPAAGHAPTSTPGGRPATAGTGGQATTDGTPAAGQAPPAGAGAQSSTGLGTAATTPAAGRIPGSVPPGRPAGR